MSLSRYRPFTTALLFPIALFFPSLCPAEEGTRPFVDEIVPMSQLRPEEITESPWLEQQLPLPPYPQEENLLAFTVDRAHHALRYYLDGAALQLNREDQVVRYTVVVKSERGGENVFHEGVRCETRDYKTYAYGNTRKRTFQHSLNAEWQEIGSGAASRYRSDLAKYYLCHHGLPNTPEQIIAALRAGGSSHDRSNPGYLSDW